MTIEQNAIKTLKEIHLKHLKTISEVIKILDRANEYYKNEHELAFIHHQYNDAICEINEATLRGFQLIINTLPNYANAENDNRN